MKKAKANVTFALAQFLLKFLSELILGGEKMKQPKKQVGKPKLTVLGTVTERVLGGAGPSADGHYNQYSDKASGFIP